MWEEMHKFLPRYFISELIDIFDCKVLALKSSVIAHPCLQLLFASEKFNARNTKTGTYLPPSIDTLWLIY